jgi:hypothetical protein
VLADLGLVGVGKLRELDAHKAAVRASVANVSNATLDPYDLVGQRHLKLNGLVCAHCRRKGHRKFNKYSVNAAIHRAPDLFDGGGSVNRILLRVINEVHCHHAYDSATLSGIAVYYH